MKQNAKTSRAAGQLEKMPRVFNSTVSNENRNKTFWILIKQ